MARLERSLDLESATRRDQKWIDDDGTEAWADESQVQGSLMELVTRTLADQEQTLNPQAFGHGV